MEHRWQLSSLKTGNALAYLVLEEVFNYHFQLSVERQYRRSMVDRVPRARDGVASRKLAEGVRCSKEAERASNAHTASSRHTTLF